MKHWIILLSTISFTAIFTAPVIATTKMLENKQTPKIAVQLHSVRDDVSADFEGTLKKIASMGFDGVEFAGRYGRFKGKPAELKSFLKDLGLEISGMHAGLPQLQGETGQKNMEFFHALGATKVIIPHDSRIDSPEHIDDLIADLIEVSRKLEKLGIQLGYHNHAKEFKLFENGTFWDYLAKKTPDTFILQLDVGWAIYSDIDPVTLLKKYPNRTQTSHFKRRTYQGKPGVVTADAPVILGSDDYNWSTLVETAINHAGIEWIVVEQEEYPEGLTPLQSIEASLTGLKQVVPVLR